MSISREECGRPLFAAHISELCDAKTIAIPAKLKPMFEDGTDAAVIVRLGLNYMRVTLSVSSNREFGLPVWLRKTLVRISEETDLGVVEFYLSNRPIRLVPVEQQVSIDLARGPLSEAEKRDIVRAWLLLQLSFIPKA